MDRNYVLFDLDGTITNSSEGIINSILFALQKMGKNETDKEKLRSFVGPSLKQTFLTNYFPTGDEYKKAIVFYREYYSTKGIYENKLYDGVYELLETLFQRGDKIALATAKPTYFAKIILKHFKIDHFFDTVVGSHLGGTRSTKNEIIFEVLDQMGWPKTNNIFMIGDREYDIEGGKHHSLKTIGVHYGYGPKGELEAVGPDYLVSTPAEILGCIKK